MTVATYLDLSERSYINVRKQMEILDIDFNITIADVPNRIRNQIKNHLSNKVNLEKFNGQKLLMTISEFEKEPIQRN